MKAHTLLCVQANLVWAYATVGEKPDVRCLDALAGFACKNLRDFSPQNISNSAWAMATLQYKNMVCPRATPACKCCSRHLSSELLGFRS